MKDWNWKKLSFVGSLVIIGLTAVAGLSLFWHNLLWSTVFPVPWAAWMASALIAFASLTLLSFGVTGTPFLFLAEKICLLPYSKEQTSERTKEIEQIAAIFAFAFLAAFSLSIIGTSKFWSYLFPKPWHWIPAVATAGLVIALEIMVFRSVKAGMKKRIATIVMMASFLTFCFAIEIMDKDILREKKIMLDEQVAQAQHDQDRRVAQAKELKEGEILRQFDAKVAEAQQSADAAGTRAQAANANRIAVVTQQFEAQIAAATLHMNCARQRLSNCLPGSLMKPGSTEREIAAAVRHRDAAVKRLEVARNTALMNAGVAAGGSEGESPALAQARQDRDQALAALNGLSKEALLSGSGNVPLRFDATDFDGFQSTMKAFGRVLWNSPATWPWFLLMFCFVLSLEAIPIIMLSLRSSAYLRYLLSQEPSLDQLVAHAMNLKVAQVDLEEQIPASVFKAAMMGALFAKQIAQIEAYREQLGQVFGMIKQGEFKTLLDVTLFLMPSYSLVKGALCDMQVGGYTFPKIFYLDADMFDGYKPLIEDCLVDAEAEREREKLAAANRPAGANGHVLRSAGGFDASGADAVSLSAAPAT